jgi:hypothetical protein
MSAQQYITLRQDNERWGWSRHTVGMTWTSHATYPTRALAEDAARSIARCKEIPYLPTARGGFDRTASVQAPEKGHSEIPFHAKNPPVEEPTPVEETAEERRKRLAEIPLPSGWSGGSWGPGRSSNAERFAQALHNPEPESEPAAVEAPAQIDHAGPTWFCGYLVPDGYPADGLPPVILDANGEAAYQRPGNRRDGEDVWWSAKDPTAPGGYRRLIGFEAHELARAGQLRQALNEPDSAAARRRHALIDPLVTEAIGAGLEPERCHKAADMLGVPGALQRAKMAYKTSTGACDCPDKRHSGPSGPFSRRRCKHQIALIMAQRLKWNPAVLPDVAQRLGAM